jgi:O-methyltransferase
VIPELYQPTYAPWLHSDFLAEYAKIQPYTLVTVDRCHTLSALATQARSIEGEVWECGVYRGGTAMLLGDKLAGSGKTLRLFDTFAGMPETDRTIDAHAAGDFSDTSAAAVATRVPGAVFHEGLIPDTFKGLENTKIAFAHVDVDIYSAVLACCEFIYPRLVVGGFMVFDDYSFPSCVGALKAVDEYFGGKSVVPVVSPTGHALVFKST